MKPKGAVIALLLAAYGDVVFSASLPVVIEKLSDAAKACGLSESQMESVALRALGSDHLQSDTDAEGWLHVYVTANRMRHNSCAAHIVVEMEASARPASAGIANPARASHAPNVVLCNVGDNYSALKAEFPSAIESAEEQFIKQCLGSLQY